VGSVVLRNDALDNSHDTGMRKPLRTDLQPWRRMAARR
jgi:hypothetical protein